MKALSQSEYGVIRSLYQDVYASDIAESILDEFTDEDLDDLTDEYIEEQVTEFFEECLEEGLDIDIVEQTICESVDIELELLTEVTNPAQVAAMRMRNKTSAASGEGQKAGKDAGAAARAKLKVSKQKVGSASPEKKASALSRIKGAVKKVGKVAQGGVGLAARAVGTAQRVGSAVKSAAKKGYERGKQGPGGGESSSNSASAKVTQGSGSSSYSSGESSSSSDSGESSTPAPKKRKDGLLKRGLKKLVRGIGKAVSTGAGAVKAGADYVTDRARKEQMNYNKELSTIEELYGQVCNSQKEEVQDEEFKALTPDKKDQIRNQAERRKKSADRAQNASDYKTSTKQDQQVRKMKSVLKNEEYEVTNADKKGNTPAYQAYKAGKKNAKTGKPLYKAASHMKKEGLDPVGKEDGDVNNDGKKDSSDNYLMKRRKAIGKAMKKKMSEGTMEIPHGDVKKLASKAMKRVDSDVDGDVDSSDMKSKEMGEFVPSADGKKKVKTKARFEAYSWRSELSEVILTDDEDDKPIKEKKVKNKIKINPKLGEAVQAFLDRSAKAKAKKFPGIQQEDYETKKKGEVLKALDKKKFVKRYGKDAADVMYAVATKTAKKKGDTSKSDDRYAYEEIEFAVDYFYEQGINEDGLDQIGRAHV